MEFVLLGYAVAFLIVVGRLMWLVDSVNTLRYRVRLLESWSDSYYRYSGPVMTTGASATVSGQDHRNFSAGTLDSETAMPVSPVKDGDL